MNINDDTNIDMNNETNMNKAEEQNNQRKLLGKPPRNCLQVQRGIARKGGWGGLNACQDGLGH